MNNYYLIAFICYFAFFLGLSIYFYRKNKNASSFIIGDRKMHYWVTAISAQASDMSDWLFMAYPGLIYVGGLFNVWVAIGLVFFMFLNWQFIAPRLRIETERYNSLTLATFFEKIFGDTSGALRITTVAFTLIFLCFYIAAELIGLGRLFENTFELNYNIGIAISIGLVVLNTLIGGFIAVAWSDMFRGIFLLLMICLVPMVALKHTGGLSQLVSIAQARAIPLQLFPDYSWITLGTIMSVVMGWGLGYFGSPHILMNFMAIKEVDKIHKAKFIGISWQILVLTAATLVGLVGIIFFSTPLANKEMVFVAMVKSLFNPLFAGFVLSAILAATMSVMNAQILACASILSEDFINHLWPHHKAHASLWVLRVSVITIPAISYLISYNNTSSINDLVSFAWSGLGLSFAPLVVTSLYASRYVNKYGALAGMLFGGILGLAWPFLAIPLMPLLPGFCVSVLIIFGVSAITKHYKFQ